MDKRFKNIQIRPIFVKEIPRKKRRVFPLQQLGFMPRKTDWVRTVFDTMNFSFILEGEGLYRSGGKEIEIKAPAVILQTPGLYQEYGPTGKNAWWKELYLVYDGSLAPEMRNSLLYHPDHLVWKGLNEPSILEALEDLQIESERDELSSRIEFIDLFAEKLILSAQPETAPIENPIIDKLLLIKNEIDRNFVTLRDIDKLARVHGLSRSNFRLHWNQVSGLSPNRYHNQLKLQKASRLLIETDLPIGQIAENAGFEDRFYFSRKFRETFSLAPREYRQLNQR